MKTNHDFDRGFWVDLLVGNGRRLSRLREIGLVLFYLAAGAIGCCILGAAYQFVRQLCRISFFIV